MTVQEIRDHYERHGLRALSASQVEWLLDAAGGSAGTGAADDSPNSLQPRIAALRARNFQRINDPHAAGTGAAPPDRQAGVELVESSRLPQCIEDAKTGSAVDSAKSPTNSPSYALFDLFSSEAHRPFVGVDQKPDGCWFACIASLTGILLDDFPDPPTKDTESDVRNAVTKLLHAHGWQLHRLYTIPDAVPRGWAIAGGTSPRNLAHAVVVYDGQLVWDPHPSRAGLVAIEEYEVLVSVRAGNVLPVRGGAAQPPPSSPSANG